MARFRNNDQQIVSSRVYQKNGLRIQRIQRFDHTAMMPEVDHWTSWRMRVTLGGTRYLSYNEHRYALSPNTVCWCAPLNAPLRIRSLPGTSSDVVEITWTATGWRQFVEQHPSFHQHNTDLLAEQKQPLFALLNAPPQLLYMLRKLLAVTYRLESADFVLDNYITLLTDLLGELRFALPRVWSAEQQRRVEQAQTMMIENLATPPNIAQIATRLSVSPRQLQRDFLACAGLTPIRYFNLMRLSEANFLLAETSLSVAAIAQTLGYVSSTHFSTAFRQVYHCSPREVRRQSNIL